MALATAGSFGGTTTANANMVDIFKAREIALHPDSVLNFSRMILKKVLILCPAGTTVKINGNPIKIASGSYDLKFGQVDVASMEFTEAVEVNIYYLY